MMVTDLKSYLATARFSGDQVKSRTREIYDRILRDSAFIDGGNFSAFHPEDIRRLFDLYDQLFFDGRCRSTLGDVPLHFRLSRRMTRAGGKTARHVTRGPGGAIVRTEFEISVSSTLLFQTFQDEDRSIRVTGRVCRDRLDALQRIMEHEIVHLGELLVWEDSSCRAGRFQSIASRLFEHTEHTHALITPRERALTKFGVRAGDRVQFRFDGKHFEGVVNRITRRATVLVEDTRGERYSDGKHYAKYYVPLEQLQRA